MTTTTIAARLEAIAKRTMGFPTLSPRHSDILDFRDVAVWSAAEALLAAYEAGAADVKARQRNV